MPPYIRWNPKTAVTLVIIIVIVVLGLLIASMQHKQVVDTRVTTVPDDLTVVMETGSCRVLAKQLNGKEIYLAEPIYQNRSCQIFIK